VNPEVFIVGSAWQTVPGDTDLQLDELTFEVTSAALHSAGVPRGHVGLSIISSLDLNDGRSISNALTAPAAAGYLNEELRVEGDAMAALYVALAALVAGQVDTAVVVGMHVPEIASSDEADLRRFREQVSSYTFDAHLDRPVGMTGNVTLGLHASSRLQDGSVTREELAARTAADIGRGTAGRGVRPAASAEDVLGSAKVVEPLTELMLPAETAGAGAVVLSAGVPGRRAPRKQARVTGWGMATAPATAQPEWLATPGAATARAADDAYRVAGIERPAERVASVELTDLSPALTPELVEALRLSDLPDGRVNPSGGVRANHPGIANGLLRVIEATEGLAAGDGDVAVAHTTDDLMGLVSSTASVLVLERA
jgi:hypothetical protein